MIRHAAVDPIPTRGLSSLQLANGMNAAFSDYLVPMAMTTAQLASMFNQRGYHEDLSIAQLHRDEIAGFWFVGTNEAQYPDDLYVIAMGTSPGHRRRGLAQALYEQLILEAKQRHFRRVRLEVIIGNDKALNLYSKLGFSPARQLLCYKGALSGSASSWDDCHFRKLPIDALATSVLSEREWPPSWQNDMGAMANIGDNALCVGAFIGDALCGYGIGNKADSTIAQLFVREEYRRAGIATGIVHELSRATGSRQIKALNIDARDLASSKFCQALGMQDFVSQYEMVHELDI